MGASTWLGRCVGLLAGLALTPSCDGRQRFAPVADLEPGDEVTADAGTRFEWEPSDELAGGCGETLAPLEFERPNLYFVIDASGSMSEHMPGSLAEDRYAASVNAIEVLLRDVGHRVNFGSMIFPGRGESGCAPGREVRALGPGDTASFAVSGQSGPELAGMAFDLRKASREGGTPIAATLERLSGPIAAWPGQSFVFLLTDGAPNCNFELACAASACIANIESWSLSDSQVCDEDVNCCEVFDGACLDRTATERAVTGLSELGVQTFVIGIPGSDEYADLLGDLAELGGTARSGAQRYYQVRDGHELSETLATLGAEASLSCSIELNQLPPDRELVNVWFDGEVVPRDSDDGWRWSGEQGVQVVGASCELLESGQVLELRVAAGCPVVLR